MPLEHEVTVLFALVNGFLDDVEITKVRDFETGLRSFMDSNHPGTLSQITEKKEIDDELDGLLRAAIVEFKENVPY